MTDLFAVVLNNAIVASLLAAVVWGLTRVWRSPQLAHALWMLVLLKMVTPPLTEHSVIDLARWNALAASWRDSPTENDDVADRTDTMDSIDGSDTSDAFEMADSTAADNQIVEPLLWYEMDEPDWELAEPFPMLDAEFGSTDDEVFADADLGPELQSESVIAGPSHATGEADDVDPVVATAFPPTPPPTTKRSAVAAADASSSTVGRQLWWHAGAVLWVVGGLSYLALVAVRHARFRRALRQLSTGDNALQREANELAMQLDLRESPPIHVVAARIAPFVFGAGSNAAIVFPQPLLDELDDDQRRAVLAHELAHVRRGDPWVRYLEIVVLSVAWWNPVVWWARSQLRHAEEQCCDAWVVWILPKHRRPYGRALLRAVEVLTERLPVAVVGSQFSNVSLSRRIEMIVNRCGNPRMSRAAACCTMLVSMAFLPLAGIAQKPPEEPREQPAVAEPEPAAVPTPATVEVPVDAPVETPVKPRKPIIADQPLPVERPVPVERPIAAESTLPEPSAIRQAPNPTAQPDIVERGATTTSGPRRRGTFRRRSTRQPVPADDVASGPSVVQRRSDAAIEQRLARLEALVERLVASQSGGRATNPMRSLTDPRRARVPRSSARMPQMMSGDMMAAFTADRQAGTRRVALSGDQKYIAMLTVTGARSRVDTFRVDGGRILSSTQLSGPATEIKFVDKSQILEVRGKQTITRIKVPEGKILSREKVSSKNEGGTVIYLKETTQKTYLARRALAEQKVREAERRLAAAERNLEARREIHDLEIQLAELKLKAAQRRAAETGDDAAKSVFERAREEVQKAIAARDVERNSYQAAKAELDKQRTSLKALDEELKRRQPNIALPPSTAPNPTEQPNF